MRRVVTAVAISLAMFGTAACSPSAKWLNPGETEPANAADTPKVSITGIKDGATDVSTSTEISYTVTGTRDATVSLVDDAGKNVAGAPRADGSSWVPAVQLDYDKKYTVTVTASKSDGTKGEARATFTTMKQPANLVDVTSYIGDDQVVGVGMPIVITFGVRVPENQRAAIQRRLFVTTDPPQEGIWHWMSSDFHTPGTEVHYRPREYWKAGTKINVRVATGGLAWGVGDWYGSHDITLKFSVGDAVLIDVDNATKKLTVTQNGQVARTMPASLGRPAFPSSSGTMVIFEKHESELFTSASIDVPVGSPGGYSAQVQWVMKLTTKGEYIHAAPWSVKDQGKRNVSHGCVNISTDNAKWLENLVTVGTPVTVRGTEVHVAWGNGVTDWDRTWDEYVKGSAIPYQPTPSASPSGSGG
jgi:lipoprotein-anchoring transpeptidase ErfK/SrfK